MRKNSRCTISLVLLAFMFFSCTKSDVKKNEKGVCQVCIDYGCANPKKTANCEDAFAIASTDPSVGNLLTLIGRFPDGSAIQFLLSWDGASSTFKFDDLSSGNVASYFPQFGQVQQYATISLNADVNGTLTVTEFDQANNRLTGTFNFKGKYFDGAAYQNQFLNVSGSFTNIPIIDPNDPSSSPCH
jgi:hypothetical protein